jgi:hypothetical protein
MFEFLFFEQVTQVGVLFSELVEFLLAAVGVFAGLGFGLAISFEDGVKLGARQVHAFDYLFFFLTRKHVELVFGLVR